MPLTGSWEAVLFSTFFFFFNVTFFVLLMHERKRQRFPYHVSCVWSHSLRPPVTNQSCTVMCKIQRLQDSHLCIVTKALVINTSHWQQLLDYKKTPQKTSIHCNWAQNSHAVVWNTYTKICSHVGTTPLSGATAHYAVDSPWSESKPN